METKLLESLVLSDEDLLGLKKDFQSLKTDEKWLTHLIKASESIDRTMDYKKLMTFIVPIERALKKRISDQEILIHSKDRVQEIKNQNLKVVLDNIRSAFNTGALLRTCETLGASEVIVTGYTQAFESPQVLKTAMGAKPKVTRLRDLKEVKKHLKDYSLIALETSSHSKNIYEAEIKEKSAFVVGNERFGLSESDIKLCDQTLSLPTFGLKNSLNVNAALSACGYEWVRRHAK